MALVNIPLLYLFYKLQFQRCEIYIYITELNCLCRVGQANLCNEFPEMTIYSCLPLCKY